MKERDNGRIFLLGGTQPHSPNARRPFRRQCRKDDRNIRLADGLRRIKGDFVFDDLHGIWNLAWRKMPNAAAHLPPPTATVQPRSEN